MTPLLQRIFNHDFRHCTDASSFREAFFSRKLTLADLALVHADVVQSLYTLEDRVIPAAHLIEGQDSAGAPLLLLAQLHGNEPAGLAGIVLAMALQSAGLLNASVLAVIGNPLASTQYFEHLKANPGTRQESRDAFRCGLATDGSLLPDMNRIPADFLETTRNDAHSVRAKELYALGCHVSGVLDIHSARGNMLCITDHKHDKELTGSPIRSVLTGLAEAISAHASTATKVRTLKTILQPLPNIRTQVGIEAGRHEATESPEYAAKFTLAYLHASDISRVPLDSGKEVGRFIGYAVKPRITYADLEHDEYQLLAHDQVFMACRCTEDALAALRPEQVIVRAADGTHALQSLADYQRNPRGELCYAVCQYDEMEPITAGQVVAVAVPSGASFTAKFSFSGIFYSKSAALYHRDPNVGPWPVARNALGMVKFCYPCEVAPLQLAC